MPLLGLFETFYVKLTLQTFSGQPNATIGFIRVKLGGWSLCYDLTHVFLQVKTFDSLEKTTGARALTLLRSFDRVT